MFTLSNKRYLRVICHLQSLHDTIFFLLIKYRKYWHNKWIVKKVKKKFTKKSHCNIFDGGEWVNTELFSSAAGY